MIILARIIIAINIVFEILKFIGVFANKEVSGRVGNFIGCVVNLATIYVLLSVF